MADILKQITGIWRGLGRAQQVAIALIGLAAVVTIAVLLLWARTPEYATAFSNLSEQDAAAIVAKLKESKTPYELANGGTAILVPSSVLYETRLQLASAGLPQGGGVGFEIFDQNNFGMTDFAQQVNYQRALEGELSRTIDHLDPVEQSRVHIAIPQQTLYTDNQEATTAAVVLKLKPGQHLNESQVRGIAQLVSSSVAGLKPENLTIVDSDGNVLSGVQSASNDSQNLSSTQLESQNAYETDLEQRIQGMLDKVLGFGQSTVSVHAQLNWDQFESNSEIYSPSDNTPQVRSSQDTVEKYNDLPGGAGGVPGTRSNLPGYVGVITSTATTTATQGGYEKTDSTKNYEISKTTEKLVKAPGGVKSLSVAVVLDGAKQTNSAQVEEVRKLVAAAAGIDPSRGDVLEVSSIPYNRDAFASDAKAMDDAQRFQTYLEGGKVAAMILGPVLLLLFLFLMTRRRRPKEYRAVKRISGTKQPELASPAAVAALGQNDRFEPLPAIDPVSQEERRRFVEARKQVTTMAKAQPEVMANLIKAWMEEDKK